MIVLFTDFGPSGPYLGQVRAVLAHEAPGETVIDLINDAPATDPQAAAYLLPAYTQDFPPEAVFLCVVDPGVGGPRAAVVLEADGQRFVGPDNGLFELVARRAGTVRWRTITWRPARLSASFHGRDLFAPVAARLARGGAVPSTPRSAPGQGGSWPGGDGPGGDGPGGNWPNDLAKTIYIDHFGNVMTGLRAATLAEGTEIVAAGRRLTRARSFSDVPEGTAFWYENANGLAEIAVNRGRASDLLGLGIGAALTVHAAASRDSGRD